MNSIRSNVNPVKIVGMGMSKKNLPSSYLWLITNADILVGGRRHLDQFESFHGEKHLIDKDLSGMARFLKERMERSKIVVLASGDPLFYGIGGYLVKSLGADNVEIFPNISTVSAAFAKIKEPWNDAQVVSLHGRDSEVELSKALHGRDTVVVYTDPEKTPAWVADYLISQDLTDFNVCVFECLGTAKERIDWYSLAQAAQTRFQSPNLVVLKRNSLSSQTHRPIYIGMPEAWFEHEQGLITKAEVRAVTLSKLRLEPDHVMWDLGAGSGSVSIEASLFISRGRIFAVEKEADRAAQITANARRFGVRNLLTICRDLPEGAEGLPPADRIFIGGGGPLLKPILVAAMRNLNPGGIVVINTVLLASMQTGLAFLQENGFKTEMIQMQINRSQAMPVGERLEAQNPVWIISGQRPKD